MGIYYVLSRLTLIVICLNGFLVYIRGASWLEPDLADMLLYLESTALGMIIYSYSLKFDYSIQSNSGVMKRWHGACLKIVFPFSCLFSGFSLSAAIIQAFTYCLIVFEIDAERSLLLKMR